MSYKHSQAEEDLENEKSKIMHEINELTKEIRSIKAKKIIIFCLIFLVIVVIIKLFFGTIEINNPFGYSPSKARFYKLTINNSPISAEYQIVKKVPIIPFLIYFKSEYSGISYINNDKNGTVFYDDGSEKYLINIKSFNCYYDNIQVECKNDQQKMIEKTDTRYTNLKITRTTKPWEEVYNGDFVNDITKYINERGVYCVEITAYYSFVETKIFFFFKNNTIQ